MCISSIPLLGELRLLQQPSIDRNGDARSQEAERHLDLLCKNSEVRFWHRIWKVSASLAPALFFSFNSRVFMIMYFLATSSESSFVLRNCVSLPKLRTFSSWSKQSLTSFNSSVTAMSLFSRFAVAWISHSSAIEVKTVAKTIEWSYNGTFFVVLYH